MAKYRHRIFEMYEFRDEASRALTPRSARPIKEAGEKDSWTFKHLAVSGSAGVTHVEFRNKQTLGEETVSDLREDFSRLAGNLGKDSKVLMDLAGVKSMSAASIDALILFQKKLRTKGSRIALCCLDAAVHQSFFGRNNGRERRH